MSFEQQKRIREETWGPMHPIVQDQTYADCRSGASSDRTLRPCSPTHTSFTSTEAITHNVQNCPSAVASSLHTYTSRHIKFVRPSLETNTKTMMHAQSQPNTIPTKPMDVPDRSNLITLLEAASSLDYMQVNDDDDDDNATT